MSTSTTAPARGDQPARERRPSLIARHPWLLGATGLLLVAAAIVVQVIGIMRASAGDWEGGALLAWIAIGLSVLAFVAGLVAITRRRSRRLGLLVVVTALLANPYLLARLLDLFG